MAIQNPDIRPEVNKEKKRKGLWSGLLSLLGRNPIILQGGEGAVSGVSASEVAGAGAAESGAGLLESLSRLGFGSGILATKAGLIAMIVAGSTLASGIGFLGYKAMHTSTTSGAAHGFWPFAPPKSAAGATGAAGVAGGAGAGSVEGSDSLANLRSANASFSGKSGYSSAAGTAKAGASAAGAAAAKASGAGVAPRGIPSLANSEFTSGAWHGGGGGASAGSASLASGSGIHTAGQKAANVSPFGASRSMGALAQNGMRGLGGPGRAVGQALAARSQGNAAYSAGTNGMPVYDGGGGSPIGGAGTSLGGAGTGSAGQAASQASGAPTNGGMDNQQFSPVPTPASGTASAAPWQGLLNMATMLALLAAVAIFVGNKFGSKTGQHWIAFACATIAAILGIIVVTLGAALGGAYGQQMMGSLFTLSGSLLTVSALAMVFSVNAGSSAAGTLKTIMMVSGAAGAIAALGAYMASGSLSSMMGGLGSFASRTPNAHVFEVASMPSENIRMVIG